jgi:hypothetical protein
MKWNEILKEISYDLVWGRLRIFCNSSLAFDTHLKIEAANDIENFGENIPVFPREVNVKVTTYKYISIIIF